MTRRPLPLLVSFVLLFLAALPAAAQHPRNDVALSFGRSEMNQLGDGLAAGVSYNRFWRGGASVRVGVFASGEDFDGGDFLLTTYYGSVEYHLLRNRRVSPYAGLGLALAVNSIELSELEFSSSETILTPIYSAGVDVNVSRRFAAGAEVRYLYYDAELGNRFGYQVNPTTVLVSAKYRF